MSKDKKLSCNSGRIPIVVNKIYISLNYGEFNIIEYRDCYDILIEFLDTGYNYSVPASQIRSGMVKDYSVATVVGKGYNSEGKSNNDEIDKLALPRWKEMLRRCYSEKFHKDNPTYADCTVIAEWHDYKNFKKWFKSNYIPVSLIKLDLDKDLLSNYKTNIYSPDTCSLIPSNINRLIVKCSTSKKDNTLIGVELMPNGRFRGYCNGVEGTRVELGSYNTEVEAFIKYAEYKDYVIKTKAQEYKDIISDRLYKVLLNYNTKERYLGDK